jgi:hypothetical protein
VTAVSNDLLALLIVLLIPITAGALLAGLGVWARDVLRRSPLVGGFGVLCLGAALVNLVVPRTCDDGTNRPAVGMFVSDHGCHRAGVISLGLVLLALVATASVVRLRDVRR